MPGLGVARILGPVARLWHGPQHLAPNIQREVLRSLWPGTRRVSLLSATVGITLLWGIFWIFRRDTDAVVWAVAMYAVQLIRWIAIRRMPIEAMAQVPTQALDRRNVILAVLFSAVWALPPWMYFPSGDAPFIALMCFFMMGLVQAGVAGVAAYWPVLRVFLLPPTLSLALRLFIDGDWISILLGCSVLIMLAVLIQFSWEQNNLVTQSIINRVENEKLAAELQLKLAEIERLSGEKTRLFAAANHDLRQPLHALSLFAASLVGDLKDPAIRERLGHMQRAITSLETSFNLMLDISRLDSGVAEPVKAPLALAPVFRTLNERFAEDARAKGLSIRFAPTDAWVMGDPEMLDRLLSNLIDNAIKYTRTGSIWIGARRRDRGSAWLVEVRDSGIGIMSDLQARIFEEFFQIDNAGRDRGRGLGLGLSIVHRLASALGYTLTLRSAPGRGSTFSLQMPACAPVIAAPSGIAKPPELLPPLNARVLVLDDEQPVRAGMETLLQQWGCDVVTVADEDALDQELADASPEAPFDLLIADVRLPGPQDGLHIARRVLARQRARHVLLLTGEVTPETLARVKDSGLPFMLKPADGTRLRAAIAESMRT